MGNADDNKRFWQKTARLYAPIQERSNRKLYAAVTARCRPYVTGKTVLELACGSGQLTLPLYRLAARWHAADYAENMIAAARKRCPTGEFAVEDAAALPHADGSFQVVLIGNALHILPDPEAVLAEAQRVLAADGILLLPTFVYEGRVNRLRMWLTTRLGFRTYHEWTLAELAAQAQAAGFTVLETALLPGSPLPEGFVAARKMP